MMNIKDYLILNIEAELVVLEILFIILKMTNVITWDWWMVFLPLMALIILITINIIKIWRDK